MPLVKQAAASKQTGITQLALRCAPQQTGEQQTQPNQLASSTEKEKKSDTQARIPFASPHSITSRLIKKERR
jgi:hypothetical protein